MSKEFLKVEQALDSVRAYAAIRVIDNFSNTRISQEFLDKIEIHQGLEVVMKNLKLLEKIWKKHLRKAAKRILKSPIKI